MIVMHATLPVDASKLEEATELVTELAAASREEEGVLEYRVLSDLEDESTIRVLERYENEDALNAHMGSDHFATFQQDITGVLSGAPELMRYDVAEHSQVM